MACGVSVSCIKRGDQGCGERKAGVFEAFVSRHQILSKPPLFLIEDEKALRRERRDEEEYESPRSEPGVRDRKDGYERRVERDRSQPHRKECTDGFDPTAVATKLANGRSEGHI